MSIERTLSMIKPDAVAAGNQWSILEHFRESGLEVAAIKRIHLTKAQAESFYAVHRARPFFDSLVAFMTEGPVYAQILQGENAVLHHRSVMGATNPAEAADGTIRKLYATNIERNACHGSDSVENAAIEIAFFFTGTELVALG